DHHNAQPHTKTRTGFDRSDQTVDSVWKQKNQGFHWENSAFLGRNFSLMVKCADEPKVEIVTTLPTVKLLMPMSGMERTVLKVD
ncbi:MAG: hypothetical protein Q8O85_00395, partial [Rhodoferax sp.]